MMLDALSQLGVFVLGFGAIWLANDPRPRVQRFGCIVGMASQPFWFYTTLTHAQWGIFAASLVYTWCWGRGIYYQWIKK